MRGWVNHKIKPFDKDNNGELSVDEYKKARTANEEDANEKAELEKRTDDLWKLEYEKYGNGKAITLERYAEAAAESNCKKEEAMGGDGGKGGGHDGGKGDGHDHGKGDGKGEQSE